MLSFNQITSDYMPTNAQKTWSFLRNPFETPTKGSYRTMKKIANFTLFAINARLPPPAIAAKRKAMVKTVSTFVGGPDPLSFFDDLRALLWPLVDDFNAKYVVWINQQG